MKAMPETITWRDANKFAPDSNISVLACTDGDIFMAWHDEVTGWHACESGAPCRVRWWADVIGPVPGPAYAA